MMIALLAGVSWVHAQEEPFPPQAYPTSRYNEMKHRSPFVLPTAPVAEVVVTTNWTSDYCIVSVVKIGDESVVQAKKVSTGERFPIRAQANAQGFSLVTLSMSPDPRQVSAVIKMGDQEGTIQYDEAFLSTLPRSVVPDNPALKAE
jgi:hypothetical protein